MYWMLETTRRVIIILFWINSLMNSSSSQPPTLMKRAALLIMMMIKEGNGKRLGTLHKQLLPLFKSMPGFNAYAIEMFINIVQNEVLPSEAESHQCIWAASANCKGGPGKNIEIDILQENRNKDIKKEIRGMGANKTDKAINRVSRAAGGQWKIVISKLAEVSNILHMVTNPLQHMKVKYAGIFVISNHLPLCPTENTIHFQT